MDMKFQSDAAKRYFDTLPRSLQENIMQSSVDCCTEEELRACAAQILGQQPQAE